MTRYLSLRAGERTGAPQPDPTLLARALGARERKLDLEDAFKLASGLDARNVIVSKVKRAATTYSIQAAVWVREGGGWKEVRQGRLDKLAYTDRLPPSVAFRESVDALLDQLGVGAAGTPAAPDRAEAREPALQDLRHLAITEGRAPAERALRLQVMAALHERESLDAEALWERSLVALWRTPATSELERVLEARAYMHLYRRPYALERLGTPASATGRALAAALSGNIAELERAAAAIENRAQRLIAEIELADLYHFYNLNKRLTERRKALLEPAWTLPAALGYRLSAPEWFRADVHDGLAAEIAKVAALDYGWGETLRMWLRWLYLLDNPLLEHNLALAHAVERTYRPLWQQKRGDWAGRKAADRPAE